LLIGAPGALTETLRDALSHQNYTVETIYNGLDAQNHLSSGSYVGALIDAQAPELDANGLLQNLRQDGISLPVLLYSDRTALDDRVAGLDAGADDYLCKPFAVTELLARIRALLRRSGSYHCDILRLGSLQLDCTSFELFCHGNRVRLNKKEYQLLACLMRNPRRVFSAEELMERVWGWDSKAGIHVVWTNVTCLRRKLERLHAPVQIQTLRGAGYRLSPLP